MVDLSTLHPSFKGCRFRAVNIIDMESGEHHGFRIIFKRKGRGYKWAYVGRSDGPLRYDSEKEARKVAAKLNKWAA